MAKTKTFAEKMLKNLKTAETHNAFKVIRPMAGPKGAVRFDSRIVRVAKEDNEIEKLGLN
jgi:hypothetical protein